MSPLGDDRYTGNSPAEVKSRPGAPQADPNLDIDSLASELSDRFRERLRYFAARRLRDREAAEDVAQEVLRRTLEALRAGRVENREALPSFLFQTARYVCMQWGRSEGRKARAFSRLRSEEEGSEGNPLTELITRERQEAVRGAFARLGPDDREVLLLSYVETIGAEEIASLLGISAGAVRVRRHRALNRLAEMLGVTNRRDRRP